MEKAIPIKDIAYSRKKEPNWIFLRLFPIFIKIIKYKIASEPKFTIKPLLVFNTGIVVSPIRNAIRAIISIEEKSKESFILTTN